MRVRLWSAMVVAATASLLAACGSSSNGSTTSAPTTQPAPTPQRTHHHPSGSPAASPTPTPTVTMTVTATASPSPTSSPTTGSDVAQDLAATTKVRLALVKAGARSHNLPATDFTGLVPGETYYAFDPATSTYWAGAGLVPSETSQEAQVSVQDDGSYLLFSRPTGHGWTATDVGLAGVAGSTCPEQVPAAVLAVWHWKPHTCRPPA